MRLLAFCIFFSIHSTYAQHSVLSSALSTDSRALGQAGICDWNPSSGLMNAAHLASTEYHSIGTEVHNYFLVEGLYTFALEGVYKLNDYSGVGIQIISDGSQDLREWLYSISYGRKLSAKTSIGLTMDYLQTQTPESKNLHNIGFELGLQTQIVPDLMVGFVLKNPFPIKTNSLYPYPVIFKTGINYKVYEQLQVLAEIQKHGDLETSFNCGIRYYPIVPISFMVGINTLGPSLGLGVSYIFKENISIQTAFESHTVLGYSSSFGFNYRFK